MMTRNELALALPENTRFTQILIDPEFEQYNELLQRVVVYVLLHGPLDEELQLDGVDLSNLAGVGTTGAAVAIERSLRSMESKITNKLNADVPSSDHDNIIKTLSLTLATVDQRFKLRVDIKTAAGNILTGVAEING